MENYSLELRRPMQDGIDVDIDDWNSDMDLQSPGGSECTLDLELRRQRACRKQVKVLRKLAGAAGVLALVVLLASIAAPHKAARFAGSLRRHLTISVIEPSCALDRPYVRKLAQGASSDEVEATAADWYSSTTDTSDYGSDARHASAYLRYVDPEPGTSIVKWYHTLVPKHSADDTYFAVEGHKFGYFGLQEVRSSPWFEGKVLFSMWDKGSQEAEILECGYLAICSRFGGEGTGVKAYINFNGWTLHKEYKFMTLASPHSDSGYALLTGYFYADELEGWVLLSKTKVSYSGSWGISGMYTFTEQWTTRDYGQVRFQRLGPSFVRHQGDAGSSWEQVVSARFDKSGSSGETLTNVFANVTNNNQQWGLGMGGHVGSIPTGTLLTVTNVALSAPGLPSALRLFDTLDSTDNLPGGCEGGTCFHRRIIAFFREFVAPSNFIKSGLILAVIILFCWSGCLTIYYCRHKDDEYVVQYIEQGAQPSSFVRRLSNKLSSSGSRRSSSESQSPSSPSSGDNADSPDLDKHHLYAPGHVHSHVHGHVHGQHGHSSVRYAGQPQSGASMYSVSQHPPQGAFIQQRG